jgi:hypothetical protein
MKRVYPRSSGSGGSATSLSATDAWRSALSAMDATILLKYHGSRGYAPLLSRRCVLNQS